MAEIERLYADRSIEAVFVEASGISEPSSIAGAFVNYDEVESYSTVQKTLNAHDEDKACVDEYGITSFVFEEKRPFNREKFNRLVEEYPEKLIRSKGYIWFSDDWEHVHAECTGCGKIFHLDNLVFSGAASQMKKKYGIEIDYGKTVIMCLCNECRGNA